MNVHSTVARKLRLKFAVKTMKTTNVAGRKTMMGLEYDHIAHARTIKTTAYQYNDLEGCKLCAMKKEGRLTFGNDDCKQEGPFQRQWALR